jgi:hypothetical protein
VRSTSDSGDRPGLERLESFSVSSLASSLGLLSLTSFFPASVGKPGGNKVTYCQQKDSI